MQTPGLLKMDLSRVKSKTYLWGGVTTEFPHVEYIIKCWISDINKASLLSWVFDNEAKNTKVKRFHV